MASLSGSSFSFKLALVYTLSPASVKRVCHFSKNIKKQSSFSLKEAALFCHSGSLQGMGNFNNYLIIRRLLPFVFDYKLFLPL